MTRHEQRYKAMTILYQANLYDSNNISYDIKDIINLQLEEKNKFVENLVNGVISNKEEIDKLANKYLDNWDINRLGFTDESSLTIIYKNGKEYNTDTVIYN